MIDCGVHHGIPAQEYHKIPAVSASWLCALRKSPKHLRWFLDHGFDETEAKLKGTVAHAATLEPERFAQEYAIGPDVKLNTLGGKKEWGAFAAANPGKELVRGKMGEEVLEIRRSLMECPEARDLIEIKGDSEVTGIWKDKATGLLCKLRLDRLVVDAALVWDLKLTVCANEYKFAMAARDLDMDLKAAWYLRGLAELGIAVDSFYHIAVESGPPYCVEPYKIHDFNLEMADLDCTDLLAKYDQCVRANKWIAYHEGVKILKLPRRYPKEQDGA